MDKVKVVWTANRYPYNEGDEVYVTRKVADFNKDYLIVLDEKEAAPNKMVSKATTKKAK